MRPSTTINQVVLGNSDGATLTRVLQATHTRRIRILAISTSAFGVNGGTMSPLTVTVSRNGILVFKIGSARIADGTTLAITFHIGGSSNAGDDGGDFGIANVVPLAYGLPDIWLDGDLTIVIAPEELSVGNTVGAPVITYEQDEA